MKVPFRVAHLLVSAPCTSGVRMYCDMAGIEHQPLKICIIDQPLQDLLPYFLVTLPARSAVYIFPVPVFWRQIPPRRSSPCNSKYAIDKLPGILGIITTYPFFAYRVRPDFSQALSPVAYQCRSHLIFFAPCLFGTCFIIFLLTTLSTTYYIIPLFIRRALN